MSFIGKMTTNTTPQQASSENAWGQVGAKTQTNNSTPPSNQLSGSPTSTQNNNAPSSTTKQQLEQLQTLREAIFSQDGWGGVSFFRIIIQLSNKVGILLLYGSLYIGFNN